MDVDYLQYSQFELVRESRLLLPIIMERIPRCSHVYNMIHAHPSFTQEMSFYTLGGFQFEGTCWVLAKYIRDDDIQQFTISSPNDTAAIPWEIEHAFKTAPPEILNWSRRCVFLGLDNLCKNMISNFAFEVGVNLQMTSCQYYYMSRESGASLRPGVAPSGFELKSLNCDAGMQFFSFGRASDLNLNENSTESIRKSKCIQRLPTVGVYVIKTGALANGSRLSPLGHLGTATGQKYRRQGLCYSSFCQLIHFISTETSFIPCSMVEISNAASIALHAKIQLQPLYDCYCIDYKPS